MTTTLNKHVASMILNQIDVFLFDMDGVIWHDNQMIKGSKRLLNNLSTLNKTVCFLTNNSSKSRTEYVTKFNSFGVKVDVNNIVGSSYATAKYIKGLNLCGDVVICGTKGMVKEFEDLKISFVHLSEHNVNEVGKMKNVCCVVFGLDPLIGYSKLSALHKCLVNNKTCEFVATNNDLTYPTLEGTLPGTGALLGVLIRSTKRKPTVIGKPMTYMFDAIKDKIKNVDRCMMVGDRMDTDILFGINSKVKTMLVYSGITTMSELEDYDYKPDYTAESVDELNLD